MKHVHARDSRKNTVLAKRKRSQSMIGIIALMIICSCSSGERSAAENNERLIRAYFNDVWNAGKIDVLDKLLSEDYLNHTPSTPNPPRGAAGLKPIVLAIREGFPDLHYEIRDIVSTNDRVVARVVMTGTHTGTLFGIAPTGKRIEVNQINIEKIENGKITEHWRVTDELSLMKQLGVVE